MGQKGEAESLEVVEEDEILKGDAVAHELLRVCKCIETDLLEGSVEGNLRIFGKWLHLLRHFNYKNQDDDVKWFGIGLMYAIANLQRVIQRKKMLS